MRAKDYREDAIHALSGRWGLAVGTAFVASLLGGQESGGFNFNFLTWRREYNNFDMSFWLSPFIMAIISFAVIYAVVLFFIGGAVRLGYCRFNKNLIMNKNPMFGDIFSRFDLFWKGFVMQLLISIYTFLWTLLFIIPGIIAAYSYALTPYILDDNPDMTVNEAIGYSKELMVGRKWRLFLLQLSFIGWAILCILTCGIGFLWLTPYASASYAAFYLDAIGGSDNHNDSYNQNYSEF